MLRKKKYHTHTASHPHGQYRIEKIKTDTQYIIKKIDLIINKKKKS